MEQLPLEDTTLCKLLLPLASLWCQLGEALGLTPYIDEIRASSDTDEDGLQAVVVIWEKTKIRPYAWKTLITALESEKLGLNELAGELQKKLDSTYGLLV